MVVHYSVSRNTWDESWTVKRKIIEREKDRQTEAAKEGESDRQKEDGDDWRTDGDHYIGSKERQRAAERVSNDF